MYFLGVWDKWIDNWYETRETFFLREIPLYPVRVIVFNLIYRNISSLMYGKGITRHSREEILSLIADGVKTMSVLVGEKGLFDGKPCAVNAFLFGMLVSFLEGPETNKAFHGEISKYPNLKRWTESMNEKYFPERKPNC
jgi:hypothetical protein